MKCRFCNTELDNVFIDLINAPPSNSFLTKKQLNEPETYFPLKLYVCEHCFLVQVDEFKQHSDIFSSDYAYFSSFSESWLQHCENYVEMITNKLKLTRNSFVVEIASNDGYLLQYFKQKNIPCIGIEPTANTAKVAREKGIETVEKFFNTQTANEIANNKKADLILGNNVLAHDPKLNDFVAGVKILLNEKGTATFEFPHLLQLIENNQFDTIYHEHFSYFSLIAVSQIFEHQKLQIYDVDEIPTHGGSLRIYVKHIEDKTKTISQNVTNLLEKEKQHKLNSLEGYNNFKNKISSIKNDFISFLLEQKRANKKVIAYGAAAKGNTMLNYFGVKNDLIEYVVDKSPHKQGKYLPGSHIPVEEEQLIKETKPDFIIIFPWNIKDEIVKQLDYTKNWNAKFVVAIPKLEIL